MSCRAAVNVMTTMYQHRPDFDAPTPYERAQGITAKCEACGKPLYRGVEFITTGCPGPMAA